MKKRWLLTVALLSVLFAAIFAACGGDPVKYRITVGEVENGRIACVSEAAAGETVTVTCTPDEGYTFKEGSMQVNGVPAAGTSFVMPEEDVTITGEFVLEDFKGVYLYYEYNAEHDGYLFEFIEVGESELTIGYTIAVYESELDYKIYENVPYEVENSKIVATVDGNAWSAEAGGGSLFHGACEYLPSTGVSLGGTYTEITEENGLRTDGYIERDYTFVTGTLVVTDYSENDSCDMEIAAYRQYGSFVYIALPDTDYATNRIRYGVLSEQDGVYVFLYNYHEDGLQGSAYAISDTLILYPKSEEIALKEDGAYILQESVNPFNGEAWDIECRDFIALTGKKTAFSRHGAPYNGSLHYFGEDTVCKRFGNVLKITYTLDGNTYVLRFHILNGNTVLIRGAANRLEKFVYVEDIAFEGGYGEPFTNEESDVYESRYYENGEFGDRYYDKSTDELKRTEKRGGYRIYGNLLVCFFDQASMKYYIGALGETAGGEGDYSYTCNVIEYNDVCRSQFDAEPIWKQFGGWNAAQ